MTSPTLRKECQASIRGIGKTLGTLRRPDEQRNHRVLAGPLMAGVNKFGRNRLQAVRKPFLGSEQINGWMGNIGSIKPETKRAGKADRSPHRGNGRVSDHPRRLCRCTCCRSDCDGGRPAYTHSAGGAGAATAQQQFPDNPYAEMAAEFLGSLGGAGVFGLGRKLLASNAGRNAMPVVEKIEESASKLSESSKKSRLAAPRAKAGKSAKKNRPVRGSAPDAMPAGQEPAPDAPKLFPAGAMPRAAQRDLKRKASPAGVSERVADLVANSTLRRAMLDKIREGVEMGGKHWYDTSPLYQAFVKELGKKRGEISFRIYINLVAARSPLSEAGLSIRNASYDYVQWMKDQLVPTVGSKYPKPYGHRLQKIHQGLVRKYLKNKEWSGEDQPKVSSGAENFLGNYEPVMIDTHAFRLLAMLSRDTRFLRTDFGIGTRRPVQNIRKMVESGQMSMDEALKRPAYWQSAPDPHEYAALEQFYKGLAKELGLAPAEAQAAAWIAGGKLTGLRSDATKTFMGSVEDRIMRTAKKRGLEPELVLKNFIRGKELLLGLGAVLFGGAALNDREADSTRPPARSE